ncbi:MAG: hypothetical protein QM811_07205 [Pirellulales bacterium]
MGKHKQSGDGGFSVSITEITFSEAPQKHIRVKIDGKLVDIAVAVMFMLTGMGDS